MRADRQELPGQTREIRERLVLEQEGSPARRAGLNALDEHRDYYDDYLITLRRMCCQG